MTISFSPSELTVQSLFNKRLSLKESAQRLEMAIVDKIAERKYFFILQSNEEIIILTRKICTEMTLEPIAHFSSPFGTKFGIPRQSGIIEEIKGEIVFEGKYKNPESLRGLEGFEYIWLIWGFSLNRGKCRPTVRPPRLGGNASMGVFATRSPFRPNSIGLSSVKIEKIEEDGSAIIVSGADLADGTPIYDIKPYLAYTDSHPGASDGFVGENAWETLEIVNPEGLDKEIVKILEQDPRPGYQRDATKVYGLEYNGRDIHFKVNGNKLEVIYEDS